MKLDIRGVWKYRDLLEEYSQMKTRVIKEAISFTVKICFLTGEVEKARKDYASLKEHCDRQARDLAEARLDVGRLRNENKELRAEAEWQRKERKAARAEVKKLKEIRWRWLDADHGWWPVEGTNIDEIVQKVPYVLCIKNKDA